MAHIGQELAFGKVGLFRLPGTQLQFPIQFFNVLLALLQCENIR